MIAPRPSCLQHRRRMPLNLNSSPLQSFRKAAHVLPATKRTMGQGEKRVAGATEQSDNRALQKKVCDLDKEVEMWQRTADVMKDDLNKARSNKVIWARKCGAAESLANDRNAAIKLLKEEEKPKEEDKTILRAEGYPKEQGQGQRM